MKVGVIGAGLGGLLSTASLLKKGHKVTVFERLPYPGGRFTNIEHKGYQLSTGALHLIPHGETGPLGTLLRRLDVKTPIVRTNPPGLFRFEGRDYTHRELQGLFGAWNKMKLIKLTSDLRYSNGGDETYLDWVRKRISHKKIFDLANSFCRWSLSLDADEVSSREIIMITKNVDRYGTPGVPIGGCRAITDSLERIIKEMGGVIHYGVNIKEIIVENGSIKGVATDDNSFDFDIVISNIGPKQTLSLCKKKEFNTDYVERINSVRPANGIKISFASDTSLVGSTCTLFTPEAERIGGLVELTHIDPNLAPSGKHLLLSHQKVYGNNIEKEIDKGIEDLRNVISGFDRHCEVLMVQSYRDHWPVNRVASGTHIGPETPLKGLFNVGDGVKPRGLMETEGVAGGVEEMLRKIY